VAVDRSGNVYVVDNGNQRVLKLAAGSNSPDVLPFTGLSQPTGVAVDARGNVYVADNMSAKVLKLAAGSISPDVLPFPHGDPSGVAVDSAGTCTSPTA
jgi:serine/threonine-protein kinase